MGASMARNLMKNGHKVIVNDVVTDAVAALKSDGAEVAQTAAELASRASTIVTMLPSNPHVREVYSGSDGLFRLI